MKKQKKNKFDLVVLLALLVLVVLCFVFLPIQSAVTAMSAWILIILSR